MPKLSTYVEQTAAWGGAQGASSQQHGAVGGCGGGAGPVLAAGLQQQQPQHEQQQHPPPSSRAPEGQPVLDPQHEAAASKLQADYNKRLREHGPRSFRWPDGSLRPNRPPPNPHAVARRRQWAPLVQHCREHGGDRTFERQGHSLRYGLGVGHQQHEAYLQRVGLEAETTASGEFKGDAPELPSPLQDPQHCFNSYYKQEAKAVFKDALGRLL